MKYLVLDIGGSSIKYAIMDEIATIFKKDSILTPLDTLEHLTSDITKLYETYKDEIEGIAISMPGVLDPRTGFCISGGALLYISNINFVEELQKTCPVPITIGNDAKCAAQAELGFGNLKDVEDAAVVILGTGIGGCLIKNHEIHYGHNLFAGEFSFVDNNIVGDYKAWAHTNGISALLSYVQEALGCDEHYSGHEIFEMLNQGNQAVRQGVKAFVTVLMKNIYNLQAIFDPEKVVVGGGISQQPVLFEIIDEVNEELFQANPLLLFKPKVEPCQFYNDANLIGALYQHIS